MKYYYDFEQNKYISKTELETIYTALKQEQPEEYNYSFNHFIMNCLSINNGCLFTLDRRQNELEKQLFFLRTEEFEDDFNNSKEIDSIQKELAYIETLKKGEK